MAGWTRHRVGLAAAGGVAAGSLIASGLVLLVGDDLRAAGQGVPGRALQSALRPHSPGPGDPTAESTAPDEPLDVPRAWTARDPSVEARPAAVVADAAPEATQTTRLRVVAVVNRDGEPAVVVSRTRGRRAAVRVVDQMQSSDEVVSVAVDTRVRLESPATAPAALPADTLRSSQWALDRLQAERVWTDYSAGAGSVVAVVDTGVAGGHPDLAGQLTAAGMDYVAGGGDGRTDPHGHGTHVAGIVAAVRDNGIGVAGLAPLAKVMPIRVLDANGSGWSSDVAKGIIYAADNGADVINLSLGGPDEDPSTKVAVNYAMSKGVVVAAAAGNSRATDNSTNYPAAYPGVLAVASTERDDSSSTFSNTGPYVDIAAPGGRILSTVPGGYGYLSGTSMATPYIAATAALAADIAGGTLTTEQFERMLTASAWDLGASGWDPEFGYGLSNPHQTLCSFSTCGATATPTPTPTGSPAPSTTPSAGTAPAPTQTGTPTTSPTTPPPPPSPPPSPLPAPSTPAAPSPTPTTQPTSTKHSVRLIFTTDGGTVRRGQRVLIGVLATDGDTGRPLVGQQLVIRGRRDGRVALRQRVTTDDKGRAIVRQRLRATTRFDLRSSATETSRAASSATTIRWRVR